MKRIFTSLIIIFCLLVVNVKATAELTYNVVVPSPTYVVYIAGSFATDAWAPAARQMTKVDDTHFTITIAEATTDVKYKYCSGPDWAYVMKGAGGEELSDNVWDGVQDTVVKWASLYNPNVAPIESDIVVEAYLPKTVVELYCTGNFTLPGAWASPGSAGTKMNFIAAESDANGNLFRDTIHTTNAAALAYKFASGPSWVYEQKEGDWKLSDPNLKAVFHDAVTFKRIYPGYANLKDITINVTAPAGTQTVYMMGSHLGWDGKSWTPGVKNNDGTFTFTVSKVDLIEYKYYNGTDWSYEEKKADLSGVDNRKADAQLALVFNDVIEKWSTTGVKDLNMSNYRIYSNAGSVNVEGVSNTVEMYDITGRMIQSANVTGNFSSKVVNAGIYLLKVDGTSLKVLVK